MSNTEADISTASRSSENLSSEGIDGDDELQGLLQQPEHRVGGHKAAMHGHTEGLNKEVA